MKKLKQLEDFDESTMNEASGVSSIKQTKGAPEKIKFRFEVSDNLKKVAKIQTTLINTSQLLTEMADEIVALKANFPNMDPVSMRIMNNMAYNLKNMIAALVPPESVVESGGKKRRKTKAGSKAGMIDNAGRLQRNLERLKKDFINK